MKKKEKRRITCSSQKLLTRSLNFRKDSCKELMSKYYNKRYEDYKLAIIDIQSQRMTKDYRMLLQEKTLTEVYIQLYEEDDTSSKRKLLSLKNELQNINNLIKDTEKILNYFCNEMSYLMSDEVQFENQSKYQ